MRSRSVFRRPLAALGSLVVIAASGWMGGQGLPAAQAQQDSPALQPFVSSGEGVTPTPTPRPPVRRAQPVQGGTAFPTATAAPTEPPVARAVPFGAASPGTDDAAGASAPPPATPPRPVRDPHRPVRGTDLTLDPVETPAWMDKVPPSPAPRAAATPAATPRRYPRPGSDAPVDPTPSAPVAAPAATPALTQQAQPTPTPKTPRIRPHNPPPNADNSAPDASNPPPSSGGAAGGNANGDDNTDIRIAPHAPGAPTPSPEDQQFNLAGDLFLRKQFTQAAAEYERYLGQFPNGRQRQAALWWLGESYRTLKRPAQARSAYSQLAIAFQEGEFVGPACLRLASIDYEAKDYRTALPLFQRSATLAKDDSVRLLSRYYEAVCLEQTGRRDDTRQVYEEILSVTKDNPYRDEAHLALANIAMNEHHPNEAFKEYEALSREGVKPGLQAEASLKAGLLAKELGQTETASALFTRAISLSGTNAAVRPEALIAQLHLFYDANKYRQLLDTYASVRLSLPAAIQPEAMLMAANSQRQLGKQIEARAIYDEILAQFPLSAQAGEARYQRIISLYAASDANFVREADAYLVGSGGDPVKVDQVRLMKADTLFRNNDYTAAALAYGALNTASSSLPAKYRAEAMYRLGYCYAQARNPGQTADAFSKFLRAFPEHPFAAKALVQRAVAYQQLGNYASALADFNEVVNDHKGAEDKKERALALQQKALILGKQNDNRGMADAFRALLKEYPRSEAAGMAHYSIGRSAFEDSKDYPAALAEFTAARQADPKEYGPRASLMVILCEFQLRDKDKLSEEIAAYQKARLQPDVPPTILLWLGEHEYDDKDFAAAEAHLTAATAGSGNKNSEAWMMLARARLVLQKWDAALDASQHYLAGISPEPRERTLGLLMQGEAQVALKRFDDAQKSVDESLQLQPEGSLNAKARLLGGKVLFAQGKYGEAAKAYQSVAVLYDDNDVTPQALTRAAEAFDKAGQAADAKKATDELRAKYPSYTEVRLTP